MKALSGGDLSLEPDFFRASIRAAALEGELYILTVGEDERIVSTASWFMPGKVLYDRYVTHFFVIGVRRIFVP
jgi:hypothetical protein